MQGSLGSQAIAQAADELARLTKQAEPAREDRDLAAAARDRLALLITLASEAAADLVEPWDNSPLQQLLTDPRTFEIIFALPPPARDVVKAWHGLPPDDDRRVLSGIFLHRPYQLAGIASLVSQPRLDGALLHYVAWHPKCFDHDADREAYVACYIQLCDALRARLVGVDKAVPAIVDNFVQSLRSGAIYSCEGGLRHFAEAKGALICAYVARKHADVAESDGTRGDLTLNGPVRLGLLWNDTAPRTENFVGMASIRHLHRSGYQIVSIVHHRGYFSGAMAVTDDLLPEIASLSHEVIELDAIPVLADKAASIIAADLDLLIYMNNITFGYNEYIALATLRLAKWQAVNFCAVITTGFPTIDIYLSGALSERAVEPSRNYTEHLAELPGSCLIFDKAEAQVPARKQAGLADLRDGATTTLFVSGANFYKLHPLLTETWARILAATPGSRLVLYPFNPNWDTAYPVEHLVKRFARQLVAYGVDPARLIIAGPWREAAVIQQILGQADIYLDSFPHSGGQSSLDALRLALPVVTKRGETQRDNQSADLLDLLRLSERVAVGIDDYVAKASALARDLRDLIAYKAAIAEAMRDAPFFDTERYAEGFAATLRQAVRGQPATSAPAGAA